MAVAFDNQVTVDDFGVTSLTTGTFTIGVGANRAAIMGLTTFGAVTSITASLAGVSATAITGASGNDGASFDALFQVIAPGSGSQTGTASWTNSVSASLGVITATGVDQTTPTNNGGFANGASPRSLAVTSASGDLTVTISANDLAVITQTTNQTKKTTDFGCMDIGPGTASPTHTWTQIGAAETVAGANFVQVAAAGGIAVPVVMRQYRERRS